MGWEDKEPWFFKGAEIHHYVMKTARRLISKPPFHFLHVSQGRGVPMMTIGDIEDFSLEDLGHDLLGPWVRHPGQFVNKSLWIWYFEDGFRLLFKALNALQGLIVIKAKDLTELGPGRPQEIKSVFGHLGKGLFMRSDQAALPKGKPDEADDPSSNKGPPLPGKTQAIEIQGRCFLSDQDTLFAPLFPKDPGPGVTIFRLGILRLDASQFQMEDVIRALSEIDLLFLRGDNVIGRGHYFGQIYPFGIVSPAKKGFDFVHIAALATIAFERRQLGFLALRAKYPYFKT